MVLKLCTIYLLIAGKGVDAILCANNVVNATGLCAQSLAIEVYGFAADSICLSNFPKGCSVGVVNCQLSHLIYSIPEEGRHISGLSLHSEIGRTSR